MILSVRCDDSRELFCICRCDKNLSAATASGISAGSLPLRVLSIQLPGSFALATDMVRRAATLHIYGTHSLYLSLSGSIVAYYGQFESSRISELAEYSPANKKRLESLLKRIVDPLPVIRDHVYDNSFGGSFSLKAVAPAILGESQTYEGMLVANGTAAQRAFDELINDKTPQDRKNELIQASLEYCKKDTLVMVELVKWLLHQAGMMMETGQIVVK